MPRLNCMSCAGEGRIFISRYGGNDPDVWDAGKCEACDGSGDQYCENHGCGYAADGLNDDGEALCADCLASWNAQHADD